MKREYWITKDGERVKGPHSKYDDAWFQMHHVQGQSVAYAFKYGGWGIEETEARGEAMQVEARIKSVKAKTTGYGDTEKTIGVTIEARSSFEYVQDGVKQDANTTVSFELPLAYRRQFSVGDRVTFDIGTVADEDVEPDELDK